MSASSFNRVAPAVALLVLAGSAFGQVGGTPVAVSGTGQNGQYGPGIGTNTFSATAFSATGRVSVLNQRGDVVMIGAFAGGTGIWRNIAGSNANANLARGGQALPAPATPAGTYNNTLTWASPFVDSNGNAAFYNAIIGTTGPLGSTTDAGVFRVNTAGVANFATRGSNGGTGTGSTGRPLPADFSASPVLFPQGNTNQSMSLMNNNGAMLMIGGSTSTTGSQILTQGMWSGSATAGNYDALTPVMLSGLSTYSFAFGGFTGIQGDFVGGTPSFNDSGRAAYTVDFISGTGSPSRTTNQNRGIVTNRNGTEELLLMRSTGASWLPSGVTVGTLGAVSPTMNNANQIAQVLPLAGTGITQANDSLLARFNADGSVSTLLEGANSGRQTLAGNNILLGGQLNSTSGLGSAIISGNGTVFASTTGNVDTLGNVLAAGAGNAALYRWSPESGTRVIALTGDTAPGTSGGQFASFGSGRAVNANNQIAFLTNLVTTAGNPGGVTTSNDLCLYGTDVAGNLILIAREGFALPGDPVGGRTVTSILFGAGINNNATNGEDGRGMFFNNAGQLVYNIGFSDGNSAVFVTNLAPVPGAAGLLGLGAMVGFRRRRA